MVARRIAFSSMLTLLIGSFFATQYFKTQNRSGPLNDSSQCACACCGGNHRNCPQRRDKKTKHCASRKDVIARRRRRRKEKKKKQPISA